MKSTGPAAKRQQAHQYVKKVSFHTKEKHCHLRATKRNRGIYAPYYCQAVIQCQDPSTPLCSAQDDRVVLFFRKLSYPLADGSHLAPGLLTQPGLLCSLDRKLLLCDNDDVQIKLVGWNFRHIIFNITIPDNKEK